jgi:hypothetical protein
MSSDWVCASMAVERYPQRTVIGSFSQKRLVARDSTGAPHNMPRAGPREPTHIQWSTLFATLHRLAAKFVVLAQIWVAKCDF